MTVGTIVTLTMSMLGERMHAIGVVFHKYDDGVQVIFENGGYDGFSSSEQKDFLREKGLDDKSSHYQFKNVMQVTSDYNSGVWKHVFDNKKYGSIMDQYI